MYLAEITFPSGNCLTITIASLGTAMYFARTFGCNVFVTFNEAILEPTIPEFSYRKYWEN